MWNVEYGMWNAEMRRGPRLIAENSKGRTRKTNEDG
jgi:hypothetical protein